MSHCGKSPSSKASGSASSKPARLIATSLAGRALSGSSDPITASLRAFEGVASMAGSGLSMVLVDVESIADPSSSLLATTELSAATAGVTGIVSGGAPASGAVVS